MVRNGTITSRYSDDENSDDSIMHGVSKHKVSHAVSHKDAMPYVDTLTNRLNDADLRLLRHAINQRDMDKYDPEKFDESKQTNQEYQMPERPPKKVKDLGDGQEPAFEEPQPKRAKAVVSTSLNLDNVSRHDTESILSGKRDKDVGASLKN